MPDASVAPQDTRVTTPPAADVVVPGTILTVTGFRLGGVESAVPWRARTAAPRSSRGRVTGGAGAPRRLSAIGFPYDSRYDSTLAAPVAVDAKAQDPRRT